MAAKVVQAVRCLRAVQYDGKNSADLAAFIAGTGSAQVTAQGAKGAALTLTIDTMGGASNGGATDTWTLAVNDWVVADGGNAWPVDAATFAATYLTHP